MNSTAKAFRKNIELNIVEYLREYADAAEASGSPHWAVAMREASNQLRVTTLRKRAEHGRNNGKED